MFSYVIVVDLVAFQFDVPTVSLQKFESFWFAFAFIRLSGAVTLTPDQASSCP